MLLFDYACVPLAFQYEMIKSVFGSVFLPYRNAWWWYELAEICRKALLTGGLCMAPSSLDYGLEVPGAGGATLSNL